MKRMKMNDERPGRAAPRWAWMILGVLMGAALWIPVARMVPSDSHTMPTVWANNLNSDAESDYSFFSHRRYLWVIRRSTGNAQFFLLPESKGSEQPVETSRIYSVDQKEFPLDQVLFQVSERNLTNYLWIFNPVTGRAMFIRARRDGGFDESPMLDVSKDL